MASSLTEAQVELINSLSPDDIPIKLRCAICSKLAINAYRLPCCEQAICETCHSHLPDACPICEHSPLSAEHCNPNKSLRTTIKVFIRTAEKKREAARAQEAKEPAPTTPVEARKAPVSASVAGAPAQDGPEQADKPSLEDAAPRAFQDSAVEQSPNMPKTEEPRGEPASESEEKATEDERHDDDQQVVENLEGEMNTFDGEQEAEEQDGEENAMSMNDGYNNMNFGGGSGDFSQMQMMMAMQNGMNPSAFGGFPMMGMPGMNMDPMQMQSMYMNGGFQGMGMNGMGGFGGGFDQGSNNWINGSQQWNSFDQNNYNQNGAGMGSGDFGFNSGFQSGYNNSQGNYGHFNDYRRGFGRGRGRGRGFYGGYGRGGYHQYGNAPYQVQGRPPYQQQGQNQVTPQQQTDTAEEEKQTDDLGRDVPRHAEDSQNEQESQGTSAHAPHDNGVPGTAGPHSNGPSAIPSVLSVPDVPLNAPTGPKAMRQGLPNTSLHHLRARGYQVGTSISIGQGSQNGSRPHTPQHGQQQVAAQETSENNTPKRQDDQSKDKLEYERGRSASQDYDRQEDDRRTRSRSVRSRSRSREGKSSRRHRRHRSESIGENDVDEHHRSSHGGSKRSSHRQDEAGEEDSASRTREKPSDRSRSQSVSADESKRSSHRSRRDRDRERRDKDRDRYPSRDRDRDDDRKKSSSHRSHRDRDHESSSKRRDRDRERDRDRDRDREKRRARDRRDRHREEERDDRSAENIRRHSVADENLAELQDSKPPNGPRGFDIKGSSSRAVAGTKDAHTLEREARDRERLLKEAQRMAGMTRRRESAGGSRKRGRDDGDDGGGGRKSRRSSRRDDGGEEERLRRGEEEREESRWD